jgi:soluble lytic murein transglycosylase-like protein
LLFKFFLVLFLGTTTVAQTAPDGAAIRARMEESLRKQAESVAKQVQSIRTTQPRAIAPVAPVLRPACDALPADSLEPQIQAEGDRQGVAPELLRAVISTESANVPCAVSDKGAMGLMQLMPATAKAMGVADPMNPSDNLRGGVRYLSELLARYRGDVTLALSAYNAGPGAVDRFGGIPPIPETQNYVTEILKKVLAGQKK